MCETILRSMLMFGLLFEAIFFFNNHRKYHLSNNETTDLSNIFIMYISNLTSNLN